MAPAEERSIGREGPGRTPSVSLSALDALDFGATYVFLLGTNVRMLFLHRAENGKRLCSRSCSFDRIATESRVTRPGTEASGGANQQVLGMVCHARTSNQL